MLSHFARAVIVQDVDITLCAGPNHQCSIAISADSRVDCSNVKWEEEIELGYAREDGTYEPIKDRVV